VPETSHEVQFLEKLQRLLVEGDFSSTYKFAVLIGLAELAVESCGPDGQVKESFTTRLLAEHVLRLYWPQVRPFVVSRDDAPQSVVLKQNSGRQANIVTTLRDLALRVGSRPLQALEQRDLAECVRRIEWKLVEMPLPRLQNLASGTDEFIYTIGWTVEDVEPRGGWLNREFDRYCRGESSRFNNNIAMVPRAATTLARFHGLVRQLVEARWVREVRKLNKHDLPEEDLHGHLFGVQRVDLGRVAEPLRRLQGGECFYCGRDLDRVHVDHFLPWARYPDDRIENLLVAHPSCNTSKSDYLPSVEHLDRWLDRLHDQVRLAELGGIARELAWPTSAGATLAVARHLYTRHAPGAKLWHAPGDFRTWDLGAVQQVLLRAVAA